MDKFDRSIQRETLQLLYAVYPNELTNEQVNEITNLYPDTDSFMANLLYRKRRLSTVWQILIFLRG